MPGNRRSIRLQGCDYCSSGAYSITICTFEGECLFGEVKNDQMIPNEFGCVVGECWGAIPDHFSSVEPDAFVLMPNHLHFTVFISALDESLPTPESTSGPRPGSIGAVVGSFKSAVTRRVNEMRGTPGAKVWQRNYFERVIRGEQDLERTREYISDNPSNWDDDVHNPQTREAG